MRLTPEQMYERMMQQYPAPSGTKRKPCNCGERDLKAIAEASAKIINGER